MLYYVNRNNETALFLKFDSAKKQFPSYHPLLGGHDHPFRLARLLDQQVLCHHQKEFCNRGKFGF